MEEDAIWELSFGLYPGILVGMRTYELEEYNVYTMYIPFIDISLKLRN